ncbi:MAG: HAMP domain-containing histidine kinase [Candidatus Wildermuthbacteria bacterium]|nr:HAMP domain-containing histidine kinase [Candidatus Wildermuthbacteria bacterium]
MDIFGAQVLVLGWLLLIGGGVLLVVSATLVYRRSKQIAEQTKRINARLQELLRESHESGKILVRKDRELTLANQTLVERTHDLEEAGKLLVRRDLELTQSNERLRDLDAIKSQFVSVAAHQLRTPLAGIKWTLYALLEERTGKLNAEQKTFAGDAYKATLRLIELVNDLLDASRLEEGRFGFKTQKQDFLPVVQSTYEKFEKSAKEKGVTFSFVAPKEPLPTLTIDKEKITIALENMVDNALKYTPPGGRVTIRLFKEKNQVICDVADTGIGMPKDQTSKIFTKFFRAENAQLSQTSGTGLGLYLAKNIIEHHGGAIFFTTKENQGSTFTFTLPIPVKT